MPEPRDSLLGYLVYNAVVSIAALAGLVRAALVFLDLQAAQLPGGAGAGADDDGGDRLAASGPGLGLAERFLRAFRPALYGVLVSTACGAAEAAAGDDDCSVCLAGFEAEAVVNRLPCGHLFHRACLETWLRYERATCPLCRAHVPLPADETPLLRYPEFE